VRIDDPDSADPASEFRIIEIPQPYANHNGGMLAFGPDGYLYIGMGDGGSGGDPQNNAQDLTKLLGKMLRIDVNDTTATAHYVIPPDNPYANDPGSLRKEIWASGLRNPWRFSFDSATGLLWAGDVGQNAIEEIDIIEKGKNYGWRIMEGTSCYNPPSGCDQTGLELPVKEYSHAVGEAVIGGYVYHGGRRSGFAGAYIYGDYVSGRIWMLRYEGGVVTEDSLIAQIPHLIKSFGIDVQEELYVLTNATSIGSGIFRFAGDAPGDVPPEIPFFQLKQNYPNPFAETTKISYVLDRPAAVTLRVYDISGRLVRMLVKAERPEGTNDASWDGTDSHGREVASGIYLFRLDAGSFTQMRKFVLMR